MNKKLNTLLINLEIILAFMLVVCLVTNHIITAKAKQKEPVVVIKEKQLITGTQTQKNSNMSKVMIRHIDTVVNCSNDAIEIQNTIAELEKTIVFKNNKFPDNINGDLDLKQIYFDISADDMETIIQYFMDKAGISDSVYKGNGQAFIDASKETGYDPIFLLGLAINESGVKGSSLHRSKNNPYSIAMCDSNPGGGFTLGETYGDGIINGAIYINEHWYDKGRTTLNKMVYEGNYSSSKGQWVSDITSIMEESYKILQKGGNNNED